MESSQPNASPQNELKIEPKVLLVDDDSSILRLHQVMLGKFLSTSSVVCADNALDAMLLLEREVPDLLVVDLNMPGINGLGFLNLLERNARYTNVAKVILSGLNTWEVRRSGDLPPGAIVIQKPLDLKKMVQLQRHLINPHKAPGRTPPEQSPDEPSATACGGTGLGSVPRKKVLVIDDNPDIRRLLTITLEEEFDVLEAADGESGLQALFQHHPKLIFLDIMLPGELNGLQVLEMIRADQVRRDIWVGLISARGQKTDYLAGQACGADAYFVKPFSPGKLLDWCRSKLT